MNDYYEGHDEVDKYDLYGVCNYMLLDIGIEHYTAKCKNVSNGIWYKFDDDEWIEEDEPCFHDSGELYIMFYTNTKRSDYESDILSMPDSV